MGKSNIRFRDAKDLYFVDESEVLTVECSLAKGSIGLSLAIDDHPSFNLPLDLYDGLATIPVGDILRAADQRNRSNPCFITITATCDGVSATMTARCVFCRRFSDDESVIYSSWLCSCGSQKVTYRSAPEILPFLADPSAATQSALIRISFLDGTSSEYTFADLRNMAVDGLDVSPKAVAEFASGKGVKKEIVSYDLWIIRESSSGARTTGKPCSFKIAKDRIERVTYKFLNQKGAFEYIHASGELRRSIDARTKTFISPGSESELSNDSSVIMEQNAGHIGSRSGAATWLDFLSSSRRYVVDKSMAEHLIVVEDNKSETPDFGVGEISFRWHYGAKSASRADSATVPLESLRQRCDSVINTPLNRVRIDVDYEPSYTNQRGVIWRIVDGSEFVSLNSDGILRVKEGAHGSRVTILAQSVHDGSITDLKSYTVSYNTQAPSYPMTIEANVESPVVDLIIDDYEVNYEDGILIREGQLVTLRVSKPGYNTRSRSFEFSATEKSQYFYLVRHFQSDDYVSESTVKVIISEAISSLDWFIPESYEEDGETKYRLKLNPKYVGMYAEGWVSAGGVSDQGGGGGGTGYLRDLLDVNASMSPTQGQALVWDDALGKWTAGDVLRSQGITTTPITNGSTTNPIIIDGKGSYTASEGDVVIRDDLGLEFMWTGGKWRQFGDESSYALKTVTITGSGYLTGGGNLEAARTIDIATEIKTKIDNGATAFSYFTDGAANEAIKLRTPRTIWGQSFDGSADVSGILTGVNSDNTTGIGTAIAIGCPTVSGLSAAGNGVGITMGISGRSYYTKIATIFEDNNPNYLQPALAFYTMYNSYQAGSEVERMRISANGNVGIGTAAPTYKLDVVGDSRASGKVYIGTSGGYLEVVNVGTTASPVYALKSSLPFFSDSWVSAGGVSSTGSGGGITGYLKDLLDVNGSMIPVDGQALVWDSSLGDNGRWTSKNVSVDLTPFERTSNKVTSLSASSTDGQYPSARAVYNAMGDYLPLTGGTVRGIVQIDGEMASGPQDNLILYDGNAGSGEGAKIRWRSASYRNGFALLGRTDQELFYREDSSNNKYVIWDSGNDGSGSGLDADLLDGIESSGFTRSFGTTSTASSPIDLNNIPSGTLKQIRTDYRWSNMPQAGIGAVMHIPYSVDWIAQIFAPINSDSKLYVRNRHNGTTWTDWHEVAFTDSNVASATSAKYANGLRDYEHHEFSTRRTAGNFTYADAALHYYLATSSMTDSGRPGSDGYIMHLGWDNSRWDSQLWIATSDTAASQGGTHMKVRHHNNGADDSSWGNWYSVAMTDSNVASATKLETARKLWGNDFNGTSDVKGSLEIFSTGGSYNEGIRIHPASNGWSGVVFASSDNTESSGTTANTWGLHNNEGRLILSKGGTSVTPCLTNIGGNWGIDTYTPAYKFDINGIIRAEKLIGTATGITETSVEDEEFTYQATPINGIADGYRVDRIKGRTYDLNQLQFINSSDKTATSNGVTLTDNRDGSYTLDGTAAGYFVFSLGSTIRCVQGHKYLVTTKTSGLNTSAYYGYGASAVGVRYYLNGSKGRIATAAITSSGVYIEGNSGSFSNVRIYPQIFDLTLMFRAGNEPETVEEFEAMFPEAYYDYTPGELINNSAEAIETEAADRSWTSRLALGLDSFKVKGSQGNITTITGGLKSAGSVYDEIVGNKYIKRVGEVDLGSLPFSLVYADSYHVFIVNNMQQHVDNFPSHRAGGIGAVCSNFANTTWSVIANYLNNKCDDVFCLSDSSMGTNALAIRDTTYTDAASFKAAMSGVMLYYELDTPVTYELVSPVPLSGRIDGNGTMRVISDGPVAPFRGDITYGCNPGQMGADASSVKSYLDAMLEIKVVDGQPILHSKLPLLRLMDLRRRAVGHGRGRWSHLLKEPARR